MIGLIIAVILLNTVAFITVKRLTKNQIVHMWTFTVLFQLIVDLYLGTKYNAYWYFSDSEIEWSDLPVRIMLTPPFILMFLNFFPFRTSFLKRFLYIVFWSIVCVIYEALALLPEPWGYFHYGWWKLVYSVPIYPILLIIELAFYKWICKLEKAL
ncbi:hypothetical protein [Lysinibacillus halotolerans]|uniref:Lycopene cyclase domain-containing protein n=1 Tax=Lysinibacillus halotolerans TaxID=1368476 RepID=A0A3M8HAQ8_9BACI|nr:hypothetical protein [Lysinibacillus halotolerans]RNC99533.1 hypothetical protein EC501_07230 [Lysinibacillus halotolerans]